MAATFREVIAAFGVDEDVKSTKTAAMMVPLHGSNIIAVEGDPDLIVVADADPKNALQIDKLDKAKYAQFLTAANVYSPQVRGLKTLSKDAGYFKITGRNLSGYNGVILNAVNPKSPKKPEAQIKAVVLREKEITISIRVVQTNEGGGKWVNHGKIDFDPKELRDQMNAVWVPQANVKFKLVSTEPYQIDEKDLTAALSKAKIKRDDFLEVVRIEEVDSLFRDHKTPDVKFTIFLVKDIMTTSDGRHPAGATPKGGGFCLASDEMKLDKVRESKKVPTIPGIVLAHEAGHFMGRPGHVSSPNLDQLMAEGGPVFGYGKIPLDLILQDYNPNY